MPTHQAPQSLFLGIIGSTQADITPPIGIFARNWGAADGDIATGIHRPLTASVLSLQEPAGGQPLLLVSLDLGWWRTAHDEWLLRGSLLEEFEIDEARLVIALTHTHSGPGICREDNDKPGGELIAPYLEQVRVAVSGAIREALENARPGELEWSYGRCDMTANRDLPDTGKPRFVCGFNPHGIADETLLVGRAVDETGKLIATIVNYACHPTTLAWQNSLISPDYIGAMREVVQNETAAPCLFLQGASGELGPRDQYTGDLEVVDRHGRHLGFAVLAVLAAMLPPRHELAFQGVVESGAPLAVWQAVAAAEHGASHQLEAVQIKVDLPIKDIPSAAEMALELENTADRVMAERVRRRLRIRRSIGDGSVSSESVWLWRIGDALFLAQRNEAYSALQQGLRAAYERHALAVLNLANGSVGYLPPAASYDEDLYPVWQTPYDRHSLERLIAACTQGIDQLLS